jgi:PREDICTED: E2F-associated phosphoprotein-like
MYEELEENIFRKNTQREMKLDHLLKNSTTAQNESSSSSNVEQVKTDNELKVEENEVLFYDSEADEEDKKWINNLRLQTVGLSYTNDAKKSSIKTDANLNCPCCMTLLCLDCQRHELYRNQYRAMFVMNCRIEWAKKMEYKDKRKRKRRSQDEAVSSEIYYEVKCSICDTQVAVYDQNEVYHFFNILASFPS